MSIPSEHPTTREGDWAQPVDRLKVAGVQAGGVNLNVDGRRVTGPVQGFGQMWQKTYTIRLAGSPVTPQEVIQGWKENFASFWPGNNRFYGQPAADAGKPAAISAGQVAVLNLAGPGGINVPGGGPLISTGIMVIYADDVSFSFMTPQGHMFAGMITFSASRGLKKGVLYNRASTVSPCLRTFNCNVMIVAAGSEAGGVRATFPPGVT